MRMLTAPGRTGNDAKHPASGRAGNRVRRSMSKAPESVSTSGRVSFQVDRVDFQRGRPCAVHGRWSGCVDGASCVRP